MKTDDLIKALAEDTTVRWRFGSILAGATVVGALVAAAIFFAGIGFRPDIAHAVETARFLFKFVVTLALAIAAIGLVARIGRPGVPAGRWGPALAVAPVLLGVAVIAELAVMPPSTWEARWIGTNAPYCLSLIPLMAAGPLACMLFVLRQGAPQRPGLSGAVAGLAASGIAATLYASHCPDDSPLFVATWYPIATGIVVLAGYLLGRRLLRW
ncbi:NrsF family protein [Labrys monachus]|uniref:DUF1109 family protein n=1 Tax=Labrys monachus TaxID=217067 RepID=A0ABU0FE03_9HYPH|nr:NrsF family protein [Labrys monachus]MDQ0392751.1 hypothetical protein [Labrys monachus]